MKAFIHTSKKWIRFSALLPLLSINIFCFSQAQKDSAARKIKPVKNMFESNWIIDNQTALVPNKGTFEFTIQHRFGVVNNGYKDFYGLFAPSNIRFGFSYVPHDRVQLGVGITKYNVNWDGSAKVAILRQSTGGGSPVSLTYFGDIAIDTRNKNNFLHFSDRMTFFNQLIVARKVTDKFTVQVGGSVSHQNVVNGYYSDSVKVSGVMKHEHIAVSVAGRYKVSNVMSVIVNYDQPVTKHLNNNPHPNISFGLEMNTSSHTFQVFGGNYYYIIPQINNLYNKNDYTKGQYLVGFVITRWWNF